MIKIEKYTGTKTYMTPSGTIATPEIVKAQTPAVVHFPFIVETDTAGEVMFALQNLSATRSMMGVDPALSEDAAIAEIERVRNLPPPIPEPSSEERIAAALEYQNLTTM